MSAHLLADILIILLSSRHSRHDTSSLRLHLSSVIHAPLHCSLINRFCHLRAVYNLALAPSAHFIFTSIFGLFFCNLRANTIVNVARAINGPVSIVDLSNRHLR